jgi:hypothetical protein
MSPFNVLGKQELEDSFNISNLDNNFEDTRFEDECKYLKFLFIFKIFKFMLFYFRWKFIR